MGTIRGNYKPKSKNITKLKRYLEKVSEIKLNTKKK